MTVHLIKLSVGSDSLADLVSWQKQRLADMKKKGMKPELVHVTRHMPKRADDVLDGGSIYWVVKGRIVARQKLLELRALDKDGVPHCGLVYDKKVVPVEWQPRRAFQGWRYLDPKDAPADRDPRQDDDDMPEEMRQELKAIGLL